MSTYNKQPLSLEDRQKPVRVSVKQQKQQGWMEGVEEKMDGGAPASNTSAVSPSPPPPEEEEMVAEEMELHVPADGIIPLSITLKNDTGILLIEVSSAARGQKLRPLARQRWMRKQAGTQLSSVFRLILGTVTTAYSCTGATPPPVTPTCRFRGPPHLPR